MRSRAKELKVATSRSMASVVGRQYQAYNRTIMRFERRTLQRAELGAAQYLCQ